MNIVVIIVVLCLLAVSGVTVKALLAWNKKQLHKQTCQIVEELCGDSSFIPENTHTYDATQTFIIIRAALNGIRKGVNNAKEAYQINEDQLLKMCYDIAYNHCKKENVNLDGDQLRLMKQTIEKFFEANPIAA